MEHAAAIDFKNQLREARATAFRDAEAFQDILFVIERLGATLTKSPDAKGLGDYKKKVLDLAQASPLAEQIPERWRDWHIPLSELYEIVRVARNDALHQGASARHLTSHAIQLALILEEALMSDATSVRDFMVYHPTCALPWQPVSYIRQQMLANSYSYLPILLSNGNEEKWFLISDNSLIQYLAIVKGKQRKERLLRAVSDAIASSELKVHEAEFCYPDTKIEEALDRFNGRPLLVLQRDRHDLIGILTAFDLL